MIVRVINWVRVFFYKGYSWFGYSNDFRVRIYEDEDLDSMWGWVLIVSNGKLDK